MSHYYTNDPDLPHDEQTFSYELAGKRLQFTADNGVFFPSGQLILAVAR